MMYALIVVFSVFLSTGLAFWIVNRMFYHSNQSGEEKPRLENFGTNTFVTIYKGEKTGLFQQIQKALQAQREAEIQAERKRTFAMVEGTWDTEDGYSGFERYDPETY